MLRGRNQVFEVVPHDALKNNFHAQLIDLLGKIQRIGVGTEGREQLRTNRDDLGVHARSVNDKAAPSTK